MKETHMRALVIAAVVQAAALGAASATAADSHADVKEVMTKRLADLPGKEAQMLVVTYPPGATDAVHRHDAHAFVYVLEGSIVMQLKGSPPVTLVAGETFYEGPSDIHVVGRNASTTQTAKFVVVLVKKNGAPLFTPVK
jgi:quercetin dioxygenase-like cupin family protein